MSNYHREPHGDDFLIACRIDSAQPCAQNIFAPRESLIEWGKRGRNQAERITVMVIRGRREAYRYTCERQHLGEPF